VSEVQPLTPGGAPREVNLRRIFIFSLSGFYLGLIGWSYYQRFTWTVIHIQTMSLESKDIELIERIVYKNADDIAISIARSFERLEERIDAAESRTYCRMGQVEDKVEYCRQDITDSISEVKGEVRDMVRIGSIQN
jgi:hypothetical protein